ncbi:MAG TPA: hypothetical protein VF581_05100 [Flavobacterium sp.]
MKTIFLLLLVCCQLSAQDFIQTKEGNKITVVEGSIRVEPGNNRLTYKLPDVLKTKKIKYKDLSTASYKDRNFRTVEKDGKTRGYFIMADANGKQLGVLPAKRIVNKGGFDVPYKRYELAIIGKDNTVETLVFTDVNNPKNIALREQARNLIIQQFGDCPTILERLKSFQNTDKKLEHSDVAKFLDDPYQIICK